MNFAALYIYMGKRLEHCDFVKQLLTLVIVRSAYREVYERAIFFTYSMLLHLYSSPVGTFDLLK